MPQQASAIRAAIDIGSNTIEVLVARCSPVDLEIIEHRTTMARLGEQLKQGGEIPRNKFDAALDTVREYQEFAKKQGAVLILALATEAMREARNSQDFLATVKRETGIEVQVISGLAEATLDYYGATYSPEIPPDTGVLDVGGGSTEIITAQNRHITWLTSLPIGSRSIHDRYLPSDPPPSTEIEAARSYLEKYIQMIEIPEKPPALVVTGSSASALLKLAQSAFKHDERSDRLTFTDLTFCMGLLEALPAKEIAERFDQRVERARILIAGALIIQVMMQYMRINEVHISSHGVREGALLAYTRYGEHWLEEVNSIAAKHGNTQIAQDVQDKQQLPFEEFGRDILPKQAKKFLKWSEDIRNQDDSEAVHKMRVASRRLRATLDALGPCSDPKCFKQTQRQVKQLADRLGTVRDTDVMISDLRTYQQEKADSEQAAGVQWLIDRLDSYHQQEKQRLDAKLQVLNEDDLHQRIVSCIPKGAEHHG